MMDSNFYKRLKTVIKECEQHPYKASIPLDFGGFWVRVSKRNLGVWTEADYSIHLNQLDGRTNEICEQSSLPCFVYCDRGGYMYLAFCLT